MDRHQLDIRVEQHGPVSILCLVGSVDASNLDVFEDALKSVCDREHAKVVVDCDELSYVNSTSFGLLFHYHKVCESRHGKFVLCSVREKILNLIRLLGLENVLRIHGTQAEALEALQAGT
ncbi:MAG: STAS domain-containing protein [Phycisphaerae bacterium]|nr:STAS domain-containing protein [Phycisphaerae bacterium]